MAGLTDALYAAAGEPPGEDPEAARGRLAVIALRRALHNRRRVAAAQLEAARPALPPELFAAVAEHLAGRAGQADLLAEYERAYQRDLLRSRRALLTLAGDPTFQEGMRLVSRSLLERLRALAKTDPGRWRHDERHAAAKLAAYAGRFATKTSPNAVFCATALAWIGGEEARVEGGRPARVDVLLSVAEARKVAACAGADRAAWPAIVPRSNPTLRRQPPQEDAWIFWRPTTPRLESDLEVLSRTPAQPVLDLFFEETAKGSLAVPELLAAVAGRYGIEVEELAPFFEKLVGTGILIAEIEPPYNARRPLAFLAETMRRAGCDAPWLPEIEAVEREVAALPALAPEERIAAMDRLEERIAPLPRVHPLKGDELFRVDTAAGVEVTLPERVRADLEVPLRRCARLFAGLYPELAFREAWARRFLSRHPADTDVPLLDLYHGLFEPEAQDQRPDAFPPAPPGATEAGAVFLRTRDFFAARARMSQEDNGEEVEISEADWDELLDGLPPEPVWSAGALFQIAARSPEEITAGRYRMVLNALFGAGIALARFAHLHGGSDPDGPDNPVSREVLRSWQPLEREGAVLAEVTYNHLGRSANAGLRPSLFRHEIEVPGMRASPGAEVIHLREMAVRWDSGEGRFVLRREADGVEVIPVISSGVSPEGFISFLVEIGRQGLQPLSWFPGFDVPGIFRWPRFASGRLVLFRRRWIVSPGEIPEAADAALFAGVARLRRKHGIPRHVFLHTAADPKPFHADLDSPLAVDLLRRAVSGDTTLHVVEMLPGPGEMWVRDERGSYATELLVHLSGPATKVDA
ncbi:MAG TPA: lantibiotic dehydratase [Thermoanaerobaculia bacterium]|nr:lantibiotic dehydratase [Thermoanaerobaculia bacterium]